MPDWLHSFRSSRQKRRGNFHYPPGDPSLFPLLAPVPFSSNERVVPLYGRYLSEAIRGDCVEMVNQLTGTHKGCPLSMSGSSSKTGDSSTQTQASGIRYFPNKRTQGARVGNKERRESGGAGASLLWAPGCAVEPSRGSTGLSRPLLIPAALPPQAQLPLAEKRSFWRPHPMGSF